MEVAPEDRDKTAFTVDGAGFYRFVTMPFGLCNAPATFERLMEKTVLFGLHWSIAVFYIDDVIVYSSIVQSHFEWLGLVLSRLRRAGLKLKPGKCQLLQRKVNFLGHVVTKELLRIRRKFPKSLVPQHPRHLPTSAALSDSVRITAGSSLTSVLWLNLCTN